MPCLATAVLALALALPVNGEEAGGPDTANARLHSLVRQHAAGMNFPEVIAKNGDSYRRVVIAEVTDKSVRFVHAGGEAAFAIADHR